MQKRMDKGGKMAEKGYAGPMRGNIKNCCIFSITECINCCHQRHAGSKTLLQQNPPVLNWACQLTEVDQYNVYKMAVCNVQLL